jgi:DNA-binding MarR family transcriptional regulator
MDQKVEKRQRVSTLGQIGLSQFAPYLMNRIMGRYNATLREDFRRQHRTIPQVRTLAVLSVMDGVTVGDLSVYTVIEQSTLSRTLDALEGHGLVRRETAETDSRVRKVYLTDEGRAEFARAWPAMHEAFEHMFEGIDDAEYAAFIGTLQKMLKNIRQHEI